MADAGGGLLAVLAAAYEVQLPAVVTALLSGPVAVAVNGARGNIIKWVNVLPSARVEHRFQQQRTDSTRSRVQGS